MTDQQFRYLPVKVDRLGRMIHVPVYYGEGNGIIRPDRELTVSKDRARVFGGMDAMLVLRGEYTDRLDFTGVPHAVCVRSARKWLLYRTVYGLVLAFLVLCLIAFDHTGIFLGGMLVLAAVSFAVVTSALDHHPYADNSNFQKNTPLSRLCDRILSDGAKENGSYRLSKETEQLLLRAYPGLIVTHNAHKTRRQFPLPRPTENVPNPETDPHFWTRQP